MRVESLSIELLQLNTSRVRGNIVFFFFILRGLTTGVLENISRDLTREAFLNLPVSYSRLSDHHKGTIL